MEPFTFFVSYRWKDTAPIALLFKYEMEKRLQFVRAFVDVEEMRRAMSDLCPKCAAKRKSTCAAET